ncbi:MAG: hypothetical protein P4L03_10380 [Terracidiphilus sp.]|nr:hypothetical protein [Terracidiphilus sp.]
MKLHLLPVLLLLTPLAYANKLTDAIDADMDSLKTNDAVLLQAAADGNQASQHYAHLKNDVLLQIASTGDNYKRDSAAYNMDRLALEATITDHNNRHCDNQACIQDFNAEGARLNAKTAEMNTRKRLLDQRRADLLLMHKNLSDDTLATVQKINDARARYRQALTERKVILQHLAALRSTSQACRAQLKATGQGSKEALRIRCGSVLFDGADPNLPPPPPDPPSD